MKKQGLKKIGLFFMMVVFSLGVTQFSFAQNYGLSDTAEKANYDVTGKTDIYSLLGVAVKGFLAALSIVFFYLISYAGIMWMKARGNVDEVAQAKVMIEEAVIGLVVVVSAYALTNFILGRLNL